MSKVISIGKQDYASLREEDYFFVDKTNFIKKWWEAGDEITLIARPRRFGKTLNMSMLNCFFSNQYADRSDLFQGLSIWKEEKYQKLQGTYPVIFLSFADVKQTNYKDAICKIKRIIATVYQQYIKIAESDQLSSLQKMQFLAVTPDMDDVTAQSALQDLSCYLSLYYGKKVILLLDEYDTPMQEAYIHGYWKEFTSFIRGLFNSTFKTNPYLERAMMTGITRVSKESIFSDLNNLIVITTTSERYSDCFGFTEKEVFQALDLFGAENEKENVKTWYDGFTFGTRRDIYNPWSITNFLKERKLRPYWADTRACLKKHSHNLRAPLCGRFCPNSVAVARYGAFIRVKSPTNCDAHLAESLFQTRSSSNGLVNTMLQKASATVKSDMEVLLRGDEIITNFDEQIVFEQLGRDENAIWSLLLASGYLKVERVEYRGITLDPWYHLRITNLETTSMFSNLFKNWFRESQSEYNGFIRALLQADVEAMNHYMNEVALTTFSYFDSGKKNSDEMAPERFYHGFVLGLIVDQRENYLIRSNRESGFGRYDIMMIPRGEKRNSYPAIILEFKIYNPKKEKSLEDTVKAALKQIQEKDYDAELTELGFGKDQIRHYGFAFSGKKVLIGSEGETL